MSVTRPMKDNVVSYVPRDSSVYIQEYSDVLCEQKQNFSFSLLANTGDAERCADILRTIFKEYFRWTPEQVRDCLTPKDVDRMCLRQLIRKLPAPPEVNREKDLYYVAWYLYPQTRNMTDVELVSKVYRDVLEGRTKKFPKGYFSGAVGEFRAKTVFMQMVQEFYSGSFRNPKEMLDFFGSSAGRAAIAKYKLDTALETWFESPLDYAYKSIPEEYITEDITAHYKCMKEKRAKRFRPAKTFMETPKQADSPVMEKGSKDILAEEAREVRRLNMHYAASTEGFRLAEEDMSLVDELVDRKEPEQLLTGTRNVGGKDLSTFVLINGEEDFSAEAGTKDGRTFIRIDNNSEMDIDVRILEDNGLCTGFAIEMGGDNELGSMIRSLRWIADVLEAQKCRGEGK